MSLSFVGRDPCCPPHRILLTNEQPGEGVGAARGSRSQNVRIWENQATSGCYPVADCKRLRKKSSQAQACGLEARQQRLFPQPL